MGISKNRRNDNEKMSNDEKGEHEKKRVWRGRKGRR